jgi:hypothetical protein
MALFHSPRIVTNGLVLYLDAGNQKSYSGSGTTWTDLSGNGNNGTLVNGVGYNSGNFGSLVFDGVDDNVNVGNTSLIISPSQSSITVNCWVRTNVINEYKKIFVNVNASQGPPGLTGIYFSIGPVPFHTYFGVTTNVGQKNAVFTQHISTSNFTNLCGTYNGSSIKLYLNGNLVATESHSGNIGTGGITRISGYDNNGESWNGNIAQVSVYNRELTASEIQQNFNATRGRFGI